MLLCTILDRRVQRTRPDLSRRRAPNRYGGGDYAARDRGGEREPVGPRDVIDDAAASITPNPTSRGISSDGPAPHTRRRGHRSSRGRSAPAVALNDRLEPREQQDGADANAREGHAEGERAPPYKPVGEKQGLCRIADADKAATASRSRSRKGHRPPEAIRCRPAKPGCASSR